MSIDFNQIQDYYRSKLKEHGGSAQGMDWKNEETQYIRFEVISRYIDFKDKPSVLDVGCGSGEFLNFCNKKQVACAYTGLDLVPEMVELTNSRFGEGTAIQGELLAMPASQKYDYIIASGTYNAKLTADETQWREYFFGSISKMFEHCNKGIIFNCMTQYVDWRYDRLYYMEIGDITQYAVKNLSRRFVIDHSYPLFEMTVAIFKNP